jgi:Tfp pilus assembly protein PilF
MAENLRVPYQNARLIALPLAVLGVYLLPLGLSLTGFDEITSLLLLSEEGIYESLGTAGCLGAAIMLGGLAFLATRPRTAQLALPRWAGFVWGLWAMALTGMFLEEINWGQFWLAYDTPAWWRERNHVGDFNLHNLQYFYRGADHSNLLMNAWVIGSVGYLGLAPLLAGVWPRATRLWSASPWPLPGPALCAAAWTNLAGLLLALWIWRGLDPLIAGQRATEIFEAVTEVSLFGLALGTVQRFSACLAPGSLRRLTMSVVALSALLLLGSAARMTTRHVPITRSALAVARGQELLQRGELEAAQQKFETGAMLWPPSALAHYLDGMVWERKQDLDRARARYQRTLEAVPDFGAAHSSLGLVDLKQGNRDAALEHLRRAVELEASNADFQNNLGVGLLEMGRIEEAVARFAEAARLAPSHPHAVQNLAAAKRMLESDRNSVGK